jgi:hypothetical protein
VSIIYMDDREMKTAKPSPSSLLKRRAELRRTLPPLEEVLRGSFLEREIRCGKPGCRCAKGPGHPLLCVTASFPGGRTQQVTVPREWAERVRGWIENYRRYWDAIEEVSAINRKLLRLRQIPPEEPGRSRRRGRR